MAHFIDVCERDEPTLFVRMQIATNLPEDRLAGRSVAGYEVLPLVRALRTRFPRLPFSLLLVELEGSGVDLSNDQVRCVTLPASTAGPWAVADEEWDRLLKGIDYAPDSVDAAGESLFGI